MEIRTFDELKTALGCWLMLTDNERKYVDDADVLRFVAVQQVSEMSDMSRRDLISMFVEGLPPMSKARATDWLDSVNELADEVPDMAPDWLLLFEDFYGPKTK